MKAYDLFNAAAGWTECRVTGAFPAAFLNSCAQRGVPLLSTAPEGDFTALRVRLRTRDLRRAERAAQKSQCTLEILNSGGAPVFRKTLLRRALAAAGLALVLFLLAWSKLYIWEIGVTGNETVPTGRVLDALRECGVGYGRFWPSITSDNLRSELLVKLPELSWATVNIYGSRAEVIVRERTEKPAIWNERTPTDVVASRTGFVTEVRTLNGTPLIKAGRAVTAGETLIAGETDSAYSGPRQTHATGVVTAETYYELYAETPLLRREKIYTGEERARWAVVVGKKRYNFYKTSSISGEGCDKITSVWDCGLGDLFTLPVSVVRETERAYTLSETERDQNLARRELEAELHERLRGELGDGGVIGSEGFSASAENGVLTVCLRAKCTEDIAREVPRE